MRNRKDSVGAKAAAWVGITLGAVVFFTGAAGVLLMDQAGVYEMSRGQFLTKSYQSVADQYAIRSLDYSVNMENGAKPENNRWNDTYFRYGIIEAENIDSVDLNESYTYVERNFDEKVTRDKLYCKSYDINEVTRYDYSMTLWGGYSLYTDGGDYAAQVDIEKRCYNADDGKILLNGRDITNLSIRERTTEGISYIPEDRQNYGLVMDFTLSENLALRNYYKEPFCHKGVLDQKIFEDNSEKLIEKYDIRSGQGSKTVVRSMSGGNQQKAIIAREVEQDSSLMIFVQPTRGLDIGAIENIHKQIIAERDKGKAILLISLELDEIMNCADTIAVIYNGSIQKIAKASELTTNEVGEFMMGVKNKEKEA